jgi:hypothetical protein
MRRWRKPALVEPAAPISVQSPDDYLKKVEKDLEIT